MKRTAPAWVPCGLDEIGHTYSERYQCRSVRAPEMMMAEFHAVKSWPPPGGLADRMIRNCLWGTDDAIRMSGRLVAEHLEFFAWAMMGFKIAHGEVPDEPFIVYGIATRILQNMLGTDWINATSLFRKIGRASCRERV